MNILEYTNLHTSYTTYIAYTISSPYSQQSYKHLLWFFHPQQHPKDPKQQLLSTKTETIPHFPQPTPLTTRRLPCLAPRARGPHELQPAAPQEAFGAEGAGAREVRVGVAWESVGWQVV